MDEVPLGEMQMSWETFDELKAEVEKLKEQLRGGLVREKQLQDRVDNDKELILSMEAHGSHLDKEVRRLQMEASMLRLDGNVLKGIQSTINTYMSERKVLDDRILSQAVSNPDPTIKIPKKG